MKGKLKKIFAITTLLMILPMMSYAINNINESENSSIGEARNLSLEDAEILVMMNIHGELIKSHIVNNLNNETIYLIHVRDDYKDMLFLVDKEGNMNLVEESLIHKI